MDIKLHYIEKGKGFPLILLHGNGESIEYFEHQIDYFARSYRVIAIDTRGHGKTPRGEREFSLKQFAEDLKEFLDSKRILRAILLGFSDGGNIAMLFALKYQSYVEALILNGANVHTGGVRKTYQIPICIGYGMVSFLAVFSKSMVQKKEMLGLMVTQPNIALAELEKITVWVLVIAGKKDMITYEHTRAIHNHLPKSEMVILEGDHFIANKNPEAFNKEVEKFLEQVH